MALRNIPASITNAEDVFEYVRQVRRSGPIRDPIKGSVSAARRALQVTMAEAQARGSENPYDEDDVRLMAELSSRKDGLEAEATARRELHRRFDNLFHAETMTLGGSDHWPEDPALKVAGKAHVSVNAHYAYVTIPAALQAVEPVFNYVPATQDAADRELAALAEALFFRWWDEEGMPTKAEDACLIKGLYGDTAAKVWWNAVEKRPSVTIIEQPSNLYLGYGNSDYNRIDWAIYCYQVSPEAAAEDWDVDVEAKEIDGQVYTWVHSTHDDPLNTVRTSPVSFRAIRDRYASTMVEVYDYWYKKPRGKGKAPEVWNAIYVGNMLVEHAKHPEYGGTLPYVPLRNAKVPGSPYGKPDLYDVEQILREKDERLSQAAQMIHTVVGGQMWQIVGPDAPEEVPQGAIPKPNQVATPGPGNELRALQPFVPQFAVDDYMQRLDREAAVITGMNDLMLGLVPAGQLGSSKAINALISNFTARIAPRRKLLYAWYKQVWALAAQVWEAKDREIREVIAGNYRLDIEAPDLTPRDQLETGQIAMSLVQNRLWSMERAMDATGVEDPSAEKALVREEQTDGSLNPAAVLTQMQLLQGYQALGVAPQQGTQDMAAAQAQSLNASRTANPPTPGTASLNTEEVAANAPPESMPANTPEGASLLSQTMLNSEGELSGRVLSQQQIGG